MEPNKSRIEQFMQDQIDAQAANSDETTLGATSKGKGKGESKGESKGEKSMEDFDREIQHALGVGDAVRIKVIRHAPFTPGEAAAALHDGTLDMQGMADLMTLPVIDSNLPMLEMKGDADAHTVLKGGYAKLGFLQALIGAEPALVVGVAEMSTTETTEEGEPKLERLHVYEIPLAEVMHRIWHHHRGEDCPHDPI